MKRRISITAIVLLTSLQACSSGSDTASNAAGDPVNNAPSINTPSLVVNTAQTTIPASLLSASRATNFDYTMTGITGEPTTASAQLFEPGTQAPTNGYPLVVWAHGTTGIANACTPSASFDNFGNATAVNTLLSSGYAVLAPDYEGFGTDRIHPYYQRSSHANAIVEAVSAVHELDDANLSTDWAIVGHSQGGHVALSTARATALPEFPLQAVVALAPGTDLMPFSERAFEAIDADIATGNTLVAVERLFYLNIYSAFVAHAVTEVAPEFNPENIFGEDIAPLIDLAVTETVCGQYANSVEQALNEHFLNGGSFDDFQGLRQDWFTEPAIASRLEAEELGDEPQSAPLLIVQGDADRQVPVAATSAFVDRQRALGTDVTYEIVAGGRHGTVAREEFDRVITWLSSQFPPQ